MGFIDPGAGGQSNVHCPKKRRRLETNHRLEVSEFSSRPPSLQDGHVTRGSEERVAHGKDRPERRLSNYSDSTGSSVSAILTDRNWEMDTVPMPPIRALYRTVRILKGNKAIDWTPKTAGNPVNNLSRRYPNCLPKHSTTITGPLNSPMANDLSWVLDQYPKEYNVPNPTAGILGVHNKLGEDDNCSPPSQGGSDSERSCTIVGNGISADSDIGTIYWDSSSDQTSSPIGSSPMVLTFLCCHGIRCFQLRLGSSLPGDSYWREVDSLRISLPHQLFGAESSLLSTTDFYETEEQHRGSTKDGQPNRHSLCQQDGRTNPITTLHPSIADLGVVPEAQYHSPRRIPSRERQYQSRLGVTSPEGQQRLATIATGVQNPEQPARSILYRPVCLQDQRPIRALLQLEAGSSSHSSGCLLGVLSTRETIPIPTVQYDKKSSDQDSRRDSRVCLPHSSTLASTDMVSAVVEDVGEDANTSAQHPRPSSQPGTVSTSIGDRGEDVSSRLAHLRQGFAVQGFSDRVTSLLLQSWREHTHSAYNSAWKKWCSWCLTKQINPFSAPIAAVLEFLTDNFDLGLQYRTVNTLRSAISTTHATIDNHTVGTHPLVVRLLKGMFNTRPPVPRYNGAWDITPVVQSLRRSSEGLTTLQLSKKVVTLLALSNADRYSDLAALDRDYMR